MPDIFFTSDTHFFHQNIIKYCNRPFETVWQMNEALIENWNKVVKPQDKVYHLGDVTFRYDGALEAVLQRLNGNKRLILGNHDKLHPTLMRHFEKITLWAPARKFGKLNFICSHIPLREDSMQKADFNVHGHIHDNESPTPKHINICVEKTNYTPLHIDELVQRMW